jgi:hypothetical protein
MRVIILMTALALISSGVAAQNGMGGSGTDPQNRDNTGWTGAHPGTGGGTNASTTPGKPATTGQAAPEVDDQAEAKDQPTVATGEDLKGPPTQFAPSKTPE